MVLQPKFLNGETIIKMNNITLYISWISILLIMTFRILKFVKIKKIKPITIRYKTEKISPML